jgi:hypothetical protein
MIGKGTLIPMLMYPALPPRPPSSAGDPLGAPPAAKDRMSKCSAAKANVSTRIGPIT